MSSGAKAHGHSHKHVGSRKHHGTSKHHPVHHKKTEHGHKHHVHVKAHHVKHAKARGFSLESWLLPVCPLEAVAMSLRLLGQPVGDDEVAWLWELAGSRELSIGEALAVAARFRLAGCRPASGEFLADERGDLALFPALEAPDLAAVLAGPAAGPAALAVPVAAEHPHAPILGADWGAGRDPNPRSPRNGVFRRSAAELPALGLILGVDRPAPHAVLATPRGWWSWGELHDPWPCRIEEAWAVSWDG